MEALRRQYVLTLSSVSAAGEPYATPLFYAVVPASNPVLCFASDPTSRHGRELGHGPTRVAAATYGGGRDIGSLWGVQLTGETHRVETETDEHAACRSAYLARHPQARPMLRGDGPHRLYGLRLRWAKLTDNAQLGLGQHAVWTFPGPWDRLEFTAP